MPVISRARAWWRSERERQDRVPLLGVLLCVVVPLIPASAVFPGPLRGQGSPARLLMFAMAAVVVWRVLTYRRTGELAPRLNHGAVLMLAFLYLQLLTFIMGAFSIGNSEIEANKTRIAISTAAYAFTALYFTLTVTHRRQSRVLLGVLVVGLTWSMSVGVLQSVAGINLRELLVPPGLVDGGGQAADLSERGASVRVVGTAVHPIEFSVLAAATIPLALHFARSASTPAMRRWAMIATALACTALPLAVSRTGIVAVLAALLVYCLGQSIRFISSVVVLSSVAAVIYRVIYPGPLASLVSSVLGASTDDSISTRTDDYAWVNEMFDKNPWFGIGLGGNVYPDFRILDNQWLQAVVQGGIVGVLALALLVLGGVLGFATALRRSDGPRSRDHAYALAAAFAAVSVSMATFDLFSFQQVSMLFFILFGLLWAGTTGRGGSRSGSSTRCVTLPSLGGVQCEPEPSDEGDQQIDTRV